MNKIDALEQQGKFIKAEALRKIKAGRKPGRPKKIADGDTITDFIILKIREDISELLTEHNLPTAIFYIEKMIETPLSTLRKALKSSIQEVVDKVVNK